MASDVQELTINYTEDGILIVRELDKEVLTKGAWSAKERRARSWLTRTCYRERDWILCP